MVLVDEKMLEYQPMLQHFQTKQDLSWKRATEQSVKSSINKAMKSVIADRAVPEDVKAKRHRQHLSRFLQTKRKLAEEPPVGDIKADVKADLTDFGPTVDGLLAGHKNRHQEGEPKEQAGKEKIRTIRGHRVESLVKYGIEILRGEHARFIRRRPRTCQVQRVARQRGREIVGKTRSIYVAQTGGKKISSSQDVCQNDKRCFSNGPGSRV
jgi:hypothetical protein